MPDQSKSISMTAGIVAVVVALSGCASNTDSRDMRSTVESSRPEAPFEPVILDGRTGAPVEWSDFVHRAVESDVTLIGELHGHSVGLEVAADLWDDVVAQSPTAALSLEFLYRDQQGFINDYLTGVIDEEEFYELANMTEKKLPAGHWRMVNTARAHSRPVIASNAPWRYTGVARKQGYERLRELTDAQRRNFTIPDWLSTGSYWETFVGLMGGDHASNDGPMGTRAEDYFRSQSLWDSTMVESVTRGVDDEWRPVVHVVGQFHILNGGGMVERLARDRSDLDLFTIAMVDEASDRLRADDVAIADVVVYVGPHTERE